MDGAASDEHGGWSDIAPEWAELWGSFAEPAQRALIEAASIGPGTRVLDVGCGSGEFLALAASLGADVAGIDPAPGMVALARQHATDVREGEIENLPWPDNSFDVVTAVNALQFADDTLDALAEVTRVLAPGGRVAIANWAEGSRNDLNTIEQAVALAAGDELRPDGDLRQPGGLESLLAEAGFTLVASGIVELPWHAADDATLIRGVLLGEDAAGLAAYGPKVLEVARPYRDSGDGYVLVNAFRWAVGNMRSLGSDA